MLDDHLNHDGLLCSGTAECSFCRRCLSCRELIPGPAPADAGTFEPVCDGCSKWLKDIAAVKARPATPPKRVGRKKSKA